MTDVLSSHTISFVIPVLNGEEHIRQCLDHIRREMDHNDEIIVVDNGSTDGTLDIVQQYEEVKLLVFPDTTIAGLRNRGAGAAKGDILAFIDSDCLVCRGWRGAVESVLNDDVIKVTGSACDVPSSGTWVEKAWWSLRTTERRAVNYIASANFVIRHDTFSKVSGFNETLITDEDTEICSRIRELGHYIIEDPEVRATHMDNPKTLKDFVNKEKWHATSILSTMSGRNIDRAMVMTLLFMACLLLSLLLLPFVLFGNVSLAYVLLPLLIVPLVTALYRVFQHRRFRYLPHLTVLYFVFYVVRSVTVTEALFNVQQTKR